MSKPEFEKGDLVWYNTISNGPWGNDLIDALGTIEAYVGKGYSFPSNEECNYYLVTIEGTTYSLDENWLEYAFLDV